MNPKVDAFISRDKKWQDEIKQLRIITFDCQLTEELKWFVPCYTIQKNNVVLIHVFKECCALFFIKGVLLKDTSGILIQKTQNIQAGCQIRFTGVGKIFKMKTILKAYIHEAIDVEKAGSKVNLKKHSELAFPEEFLNKLEAVPALKLAFDALTPGRQGAYALYFSTPKLSKTRQSRVEKCTGLILDGLGLND